MIANASTLPFRQQAVQGELLRPLLLDLKRLSELLFCRCCMTRSHPHESLARSVLDTNCVQSACRKTCVDLVAPGRKWECHPDPERKLLTCSFLREPPHQSQRAPPCIAASQ